MTYRWMYLGEARKGKDVCAGKTPRELLAHALAHEHGVVPLPGADPLELGARRPITDKDELGERAGREDGAQA